MELGKHVVDKELADRAGNRAGKVDDLLLVIPEPRPDGTSEEPEVVAVITGPLALARNLPRWMEWIARRAYGLLGVRHPEPVEIPWHNVSAIDVILHLDVSRDQAGLMVLAQAVDRRFISHIPGH